MTTITYVKPSGLGAWWIGRTQHLLFGYRGKLDMKSRYHPTVQSYVPKRHSAKPESSFELIEKVSHPNYLECFARTARPGWSVWGNEVESTVEIPGGRTGVALLCLLDVHRRFTISTDDDTMYFADRPLDPLE